MMFGMAVSAFSQPIGAGMPAPIEPFRVVCPLTLPPDAMPTRKIADGWVVSVPGQRTWPWRERAAGILHGPPDWMGHLIPGSIKETKVGKRNIIVMRWTFDVPHPNENWAFCGYGPIEMARRVPAYVKECAATVAEDQGRPLPTAFECK
jgi:hypothetical protein